jgi:nucleotide-binding universal stress UspA family protein
MENTMVSSNLPLMSGPRSILVATDLTDLNFVLPVAINQARVSQAVIWLLHILPQHLYVSTPSSAGPLVLEAKQFRDAEATLAKVAQQIRDLGLTCSYEVRRWYPAEQIKEFINEHAIDRLLIGTSGRGKLGKLFIGSVAEELIRTLEIPVCTVGPHFRSCQQDNPRRMIAALSLRHHPEHSLLFAARLAAELQSELTVLHVAEQDRGDEGIHAGARAKINELLRTVDLHPAPKIRIRSGEPAEEIICECAAVRPEALIMSASPASIFKSRIRNGVAYRVIAQASCPTFTLHSGSKAKASGTYREFSGISSGSPDFV